MRRFLREPLLHFLILGALLFVLYGWVARAALQAPNEIIVDQAQIKALDTQFERIWQRSPSADERQGLVDNWIREEIIYREGVAAGMERGDEVVRRRVVQKMEFLSESMASDVPTEQDLQTWLAQNADRYRIGPVYTLQQFYFDPSRHGRNVDEVAQHALAELQRDPTAVVGDPTLLPAIMNGADAATVTRAFGERFANAIGGLPEARWSGPIASGFGLHVVRIQQRQAGRLAKLDEVRPAVERDLVNARAKQANSAFYQDLRKRYTVKVEGVVERNRTTDGTTPAGSQ